MHALGALAGVLLATNIPTLAHMALYSPSPFNGTNNPHRTTAADPYLEYPYDCCGENDRWEYPCRGYHRLLGTPQGAPTATWEAGSTQTWSISGIGNHFGGSCQVGFSIDRGITYRVAASYEGNCPHRNNGNGENVYHLCTIWCIWLMYIPGPSGQDFHFKVPGDVEQGVHIFAWIWHNREQEFNMNCAAVNITTPTADSSVSLSSPPTQPTYSLPSAPAPNAVSQGVAFNDRPFMFVADDGNDCLTPHTTAELKYPNPGPHAVQGDGVYPLELPSGACDMQEMLVKQAYLGVSNEHGHGS